MTQKMRRRFEERHQCDEMTQKMRRRRDETTEIRRKRVEVTPKMRRRRDVMIEEMKMRRKWDAEIDETMIGSRERRLWMIRGEVRLGYLRLG